jgi:hypothetical protein
VDYNFIRIKLKTNNLIYEKNQNDHIFKEKADQLLWEKKYVRTIKRIRHFALHNYKWRKKLAKEMKQVVDWFDNYYVI